MDHSPHLFSVIVAAVKAGDTVMEVYSTDFSIDHKSDHSPVTLADKQANEVIISVLKTTEIPFISEESAIPPFEERWHWERFWLIDPLDGTKEFVKRNGEFSINIGLIDHGVPTLGVIYAPVPDLLYFTDGQHAVKLEHARAKVLASKDISTLYQAAITLPVPVVRKEFIVVTSRSHKALQDTNFLTDLQSKFGELRMQLLGSSLKLCWLTDGQADMYPRFGTTYEWDTAAGHALVRAVGGELIQTSSGKPIEYNKPDLKNTSFIAYSPSYKQF
ncbi:MAG: 3'(2'),5'-bisphosphate nucleotidase CysQ [Bacteroidales bacterium]|jgi:3'(2'), 5'-bisphosphate nucleotidase|nr:3'(2'),5'-bisphosphate nucleotidase CysQ [Bacteroidales bacterium]MDD3700852.1 3'(2'),5'-bisphosphate nucleotidase CysQ [Bacteroidales bacterium]MDY0369437.1 3'(2'),5'-bisphosphate nucleotidase CysQ [Bacteroidales bacterium]